MTSWWRAVRLFPAFWVAVALTSACAMLMAPPSMAVTPAQVVANLTMLPSLFGAGFVDGVYWTLQLELVFYAMVLLALLAGQQERLETLFLCWPLAILAAALSGYHWLPLAGGYYTFFAAGAVLAVARTRRGLLPWVATAVCAALCITTTAREALRLATRNGLPMSEVAVGLVVLLMFVFFALINTDKVRALSLPGARVAGALTYPIYLLHAHIGYMLLGRFGNDDNRWQVYPAVIAVVLLCAFFVYRAERRLQPAARALFERLLGRPVAWLERIGPYDAARRAPR